MAAPRSYHHRRRCARALIIAAAVGRAQAQVGSWQTLAGYETSTDVGPHSMIDLDMEELETNVKLLTDAGFTEAIRIYTNGGGGFCSQADVDDPAINQCTAVGDPKGNSVKGSGAIRMLKGFATAGEAKMMGWTTYPIYYAYWNDYNYADTLITKDYSAIVKDVGRAQLIQKGACYQAIWMYVLHQFEDGIYDCTPGDATANEHAAHAWNQGWAFYSGSLVAATAADSARSSTASADGVLIWEISEKRGADFGTLDTTGPSKANVKALAAAVAGRDQILASTCSGLPDQLKILTQQMTVPLIQDLIKNAWRMDPAGGDNCAADAGKNALTASDECVKNWAEAWAFAAAVLPQVHQCNAAAATTIRDNVDITAVEPMKDGFAAVKAALESTYPCLGITCADVGAYQSSGVVYTGADACTTETPAK